MNKKTAMRTSCSTMFAIAMGVFVSVQAGDLQPPPGAPAPTLLRVPSDVAKTGQFQCTDAVGVFIPCAGTGQDGAYQAGASVGPRFTDNGNGTVKDNLTGLIWLKNANCNGGSFIWTTAFSISASVSNGLCGLSDGSLSGDWRLPNLRELQSLIDYSRALPALPAGHPFSGVQSGFYWSSTAWAFNPGFAWRVDLQHGGVGRDGIKAQPVGYVWPVRGGQ